MPSSNYHSFPILTIITVTLNDLKGFLLTADSIIPNLSLNIQWIIKDGGSAPEILSAIQSVARTYSQLYSFKDNSIYSGMNYALNHAKGKFVVFMNGGDTFSSANCLPSLCDLLANELDDTSIYIFPYIEVDCAGNKIYRRCNSSAHSIFQLWRMPTISQSQVFPKSIYSQLRFDESFVVSADHQFYWSAALKSNYNIKTLDFPLAIFQLGGVSSTNPLKSCVDVFSYLRKYSSVGIFSLYSIMLIRISASCIRYLIYMFKRTRIYSLIASLNHRSSLIVWALGVNGEGSSVIAHEWINYIAQNQMSTLFVFSNESTLSKKFDCNSTKFVNKNARISCLKLPSFCRHYTFHFLVKLLFPVNFFFKSVLVFDDFPFLLASNQVLYFQQLNLLIGKSFLWKLKQLVFLILVSSRPSVYCQTEHVLSSFKRRFPSLECFSFLHEIK